MSDSAKGKLFVIFVLGMCWYWIWPAVSHWLDDPSRPIQKSTLELAHVYRATESADCVFASDEPHIHKLKRGEKLMALEQVSESYWSFYLLDYPALRGYHGKVYCEARFVH